MSYELSLATLTLAEQLLFNVSLLLFRVKPKPEKA